MEKQFTLVLAAFWLLLAGSGTAAAQDDYAVFRDEAREASLLYRGHKAFEYSLLFNGTYFWESPEFNTGDVIYCGKEYRDIELNIDAARHELIVRIGKGISPKVLGREYVQECHIGDRHFLNLQFLYGADVPFGYWEVLHEGRNKVLRRVDKHLEQDLEGNKRDQTHYVGTYRPNVYQTFVYVATYCFMTEDGRIVPVRRRQDVLRLLDKERRGEVRRHLRQKEASGRFPFDRFCVEVAQYLETR
jgi:hypothetical protein